MDLLTEYDELVDYPLFSKLQPGDKVYVKILPDTILHYYGLRSGLHTIGGLRECRGNATTCPDCTTNYLCVYVFYGSDLNSAGICRNYIYDCTGKRFREDFPYYVEYPTYADAPEVVLPDAE